MQDKLRIAVGDFSAHLQYHMKKAYKKQRQNLVIFFLLNGRGSLRILGINHLSDIWFANTFFSHYICCPFILLIASLAVQNFLVSIGLCDFTLLAPVDNY